MRKIILLGGLCSALFIAGSCNGPKVVERHYQQYKGDNRAGFAKDCADNFPIIPQVVKGKDSLRIDTLWRPGERIPCPEADPVTGKKTFVQCPPCPEVTKAHSRIDTVKIPDRAREEQLRLEKLDADAERDAAKSKLQIAESDRDAWKKKAKNRGGILIAICCGVGLIIVFKILRAFKVF